jgi:transposase
MRSEERQEVTALRPSSRDLRERVAAAVKHHEGSIRQIARTFRVSTSFLVRLLPRRRHAGTIAPKPHGGGPPPALGPDDQERLADLIREQPDATWEQLRQRGGFTCSVKTLWLAWRHRRLTRTKKSRHARERDRPEVQKKRRSFRRAVRQIEPKHRIFVDETGVTTAMTPADAWAACGARAVDSAPASWETVTLIAALGRDGVCAPLAFPGATDTAAFPTDVDQVLVPAWHAGDVVVRDHRKPPLASGVAASIERVGARVRPLPPYRPDDTPIEAMFSKVKQGLRRAEARTEARLSEALGAALRRVTPKDILGWFQHAGLCLHSARTEDSQATSLSTRSSRCRIFCGSGRQPQLC